MTAAREECGAGSLSRQLGTGVEPLVRDAPPQAATPIAAATIMSPMTACERARLITLTAPPCDTGLSARRSAHCRTGTRFRRQGCLACWSAARLLAASRPPRRFCGHATASEIDSCSVPDEAAVRLGTIRRACGSRLTRDPRLRRPSTPSEVQGGPRAASQFGTLKEHDAERRYAACCV